MCFYTLNHEKKKVISQSLIISLSISSSLFNRLTVLQLIYLIINTHEGLKNEMMIVTS